MVKFLFFLRGCVQIVLKIRLYKLRKVYRLNRMYSLSMYTSNGRIYRHLSMCCLLFLVVAVSVSTVPAQDDRNVVSSESGTEYKTGIELYSAGKYDDAIAHFEKAYALDSRNVAALFAHGLALNKPGKYKEAAEQFGMVLDNDPGHKKALRLYPAALARTGNTKKTLAAYDRVIAAAPDDYYLYWSKARYLIKLKKYDEAVTNLHKSIELDSKQPAVYETLAFVYREQKKTGDALSAYDKALALKPGDTKYMYYRAQTLFELGKMKEAFDAATQILAQNKNHARARIITADYKRLKGQYDEALAAYAIAAKNIETKAYAEHFINVINQKLEEIEIEKEWEAQQKQKESK